MKGLVAAIALGVLLAAPALLSLAPEASPSQGVPGAWVRIEGRILSIGNAFITAKFNLSRGVSLENLTVLDSTVMRCLGIEYAGLHISAFTGAAPSNATTSSLVRGAWEARVADNTSERVIVELTPTSEAAIDVEPLQVKVLLVLDKYSPYLTYIVNITNPAGSPITLVSPSRGGAPLGLDVYMASCLSAPQNWVFTVAYGGYANASVARVRGSLNETVETPLYPVNATLAGAAAFYEDKEAPSYVLFATSSGASYYAADITKKGIARVHIFTEPLLIPAGGSYTLTVRAGALPFNPTLLAMAGLGPIARLAYPTLFLELSYKQAQYEQVVSRLNSTIHSLNQTLNHYRESYEKCTNESSTLRSKVNELKELLDTCNINLNITKNDLARANENVRKCALKIVALTTVGLVVGVAGGLTVASARRGAGRYRGAARR